MGAAGSRVDIECRTRGSSQILVKHTYVRGANQVDWSGYGKGGDRQRGNRQRAAIFGQTGASLLDAVGQQVVQTRHRARREKTTWIWE